MKKYGLYLMMLVATMFCATSCGDDDDDNHLERWMVANQEAINAIAKNAEYKELKSPGNEGSIYYKVLEKGNGTDSIYYTSTVTCYYKGWFVADYPEYNIKKDDIFNQYLFDDGAPVSFTVSESSLRKGWKTALQHMVQGDKWEIWLPYQLGYGREGSGSIPGYSTLVFEIEVVSVKGIDD